MHSDSRFSSAEGSRGMLYMLTLASILIQLLLSVMWVWVWMYIESGHLHQQIWVREIAARLSITSWVWLAFAVVALLQLIALAVWIYIVHRNLAVLQHRARLTPLLAALVQFLPLVNCILTPYAFLEIWWGSDPGRLPHATERRSPPISVLTWSLLFCFTSFLGLILANSLNRLVVEIFRARAVMGSVDIGYLRTLSGQAIWGLAFLGLAILTNVVLLLLVHEITSLQRRRFDRLYPSRQSQEVVLATIAEESQPA